MTSRTLRFLVAAAVGASLLAAAVPASAQERTVTITGGGWGHGIGMSQYGALGRAQKGKSATQILEHYYSGTSVTSRSSSGPLKVGLLPTYGSNQGAVTFTGEAISGSGRIDLKVKGEREILATVNPGVDVRAEASSTGGLRIFLDGERLRRGGDSVFGGASNPVLALFEKHGTALDPAGKANRYLYGKAELGTYSSTACSDGRCARLVLKLPMQKYLYGLGEVPSSWPDAALRAQAIAGRTYAYARKVRYDDPNLRLCGCHVYDTVIDQAYVGDAKRTGSGEHWAAWKGAVDDTKDLLILHGGGVIEYALYSSSSGGHTENNENVWGGSPVPYLRGVKDGPDRAGGANPNFTWKVEMTYKEFSSKLNARFGTGKLKDFELLKPFGVSGRVTVPRDDKGGARITGSAKVVRESGWNLRSALGLRDSLFRVDLGFEVGSRFAAKHRKLDGAPGRAVSKVYDVPRGWKRPRGVAQDFRKGRMTYVDESDKVVWQYGRILKAYDRSGREGSKLGLPRSGVWGGKGYQGATYDRGRLVRVKGRGVVAIRGGFDAAFTRTGGIDGRLGLPRGPRSTHKELPRGGQRQRFAAGTLYKAGKDGRVFALFRALDERYRKMGQGRSPCGYPTADMVKDGDSWRATFTKGQMILRSSGRLIVACG